MSCASAEVGSNRRWGESSRIFQVCQYWSVLCYYIYIYIIHSHIYIYIYICIDLQFTYIIILVYIYSVYIHIYIHELNTIVHISIISYIYIYVYTYIYTCSTCYNLRINRIWYLFYKLRPSAPSSLLPLPVLWLLLQTKTLERSDVQIFGWAQPLPGRSWLDANPVVGRKGNAFWCGYGSIPIDTIFSGMNIHLPAILMFTRGTRVLTHCQCQVVANCHCMAGKWRWRILWVELVGEASKNLTRKTTDPTLIDFGCSNMYTLYMATPDRSWLWSVATLNPTRGIWLFCLFGVTVKL